MAAIRGTDTKPELIIRRGLHVRGFRYSLHNRKLPGRPDLVLPKYRAVIFINGCFWHGHDCPLFKWPKSRKDFWRDKINGNVERDDVNSQKLSAAGWRIAKVWECALKGRQRIATDTVLTRLAEWLGSSSTELVIKGEDQETTETRA